MQHWTYQSRRLRDAHYRELRKQGVSADRLRRYSMRNQCVHPMYIEDYPKQGLDTGYGNTVYKTLFGSLYCLERRDW